ncbi:RHS repeat-associated core domain-containing protein [Arthrobacter crystallopoietes]|uniref:RHS repeat protein n=1 Tax=Crystallibacter crystallopoietes TaxID=37928 RepID=UPI003D25ADD8
MHILDRFLNEIESVEVEPETESDGLLRLELEVAEREVQLTTEGPPPLERVAGLQIRPDHAEVALGSSIFFVATAEDDRGIPITGAAVAWRATDAAGTQLPISPDGMLVASQAGEYTVAAAASDAESAVTVTVREGLADSSDGGVTRLATPPAALAGADYRESDPAPRWDEATARSAFALTNRRGTLVVDERFEAALSRASLGVRSEALDEAVSVGKTSYRFTAAVLQLPGRGLDLALDLTYNSGLWHEAPGRIAFDIDGGWPAPGWSLGFGRIVRLRGQGSVLVDADGTRHSFEVVSLRGDQARRWEFVGRTSDGTLIDYTHIDDATGGFQWAVARYPDGRAVEYTARGHDRQSPARPSWGVLYPTRITDANGNYLTITYRDNAGPEIDTIVDTLGRSVQFHYDAAGLLTAITAPTLYGGVRTIVRLMFNQLQLAEPRAAFGILEVSAPETTPVLEGIYYPGSATGYWFRGAYSPYGTLSATSQHRGMGFDDAPLTETGTITPGTMTRRRSYDYPMTPAALTGAPRYTTMTETWEDMDTPAAITQYIAQEDASPRRLETIHPTGARTVALAHNHPGQYDDGVVFELTTYRGSAVLRRYTFTWEQGDYRSPRLARVEISDELAQTTATEYFYGPLNHVRESRELDYDGTTVLRRVLREYETRPGYLERHNLALPTVIEHYRGNDQSPSSRIEYGYDDEPLWDVPDVRNHAMTHNPYASRTWVPPRVVRECDPERRPPCLEYTEPGYWQTLYNEATRFRGNLTQITRYKDAAERGGPLVERRTYDITGNPRYISRPGGTDSGWGYDADTQYAFPTIAVHGAVNTGPARLINRIGYDAGTGAVLTVTDAAGRVTQTDYDPATLRITTVTTPSGATISYKYEDRCVTETTGLADGTMAGQRRMWLNGLGFPRREETLTPETHPTGETVWNVVETQYDAAGRPWRHSRPFRPVPGQPSTPSWSEISYDSLGRINRLQGPDGSLSHRHYNEAVRPSVASDMPGQTLRTIDAWGREHWSLRNALGQLTMTVGPHPESAGSVLEDIPDPDRPGQLKQHPTALYAFDPQDRLLGITQYPARQSRKFRYNGLGNLTHQALPERSLTLNDAGETGQPGPQWSDVFLHDEAGRLIRHVDARGVSRIYGYGGDPLNRLQAITYDTAAANDPANPVQPASGIHFEYVTTGDLTCVHRVITDSVTEEYGYDPQGRLNSRQYLLPGRKPLAIGYEHDSMDRITVMRYPAMYGMPDERRIKVRCDYGIDGAIHSLRLDNQVIVSEISHDPDGLPAAVTFNPLAAPPGIVERYLRDKDTGLLRTQQIIRGSDPTNTDTLLDLSYDYLQEQTGGGVTGQLVHMDDHIDRSRGRIYHYDALGRLYRAEGGDPAAPLWKQEYGYDIHGNRTTVTAVGTAADGSAIPVDGRPSTVFDTATNRIKTRGFTYDSTGNLTRGQRQDGSWQRYSYDAAGRLCRVTDDAGADIESYLYGAGRQRLQIHDTVTDHHGICVWHGDTVIASYDDTGSALEWRSRNVYLGERLLASYERPEPSPAALPLSVRYHHPGLLGTGLTTQLHTDSPIDIAALPAVLPFGTVLDAETTGTTPRPFGSYERSAATGVDYAVNRHYLPDLARFLEPDPLGAAAITAGGAGSNNQYAYCQEDPINRIDPAGLIWIRDLRSISYWEGDTLVVTGRWEYRWVDDPDEFAREELQREGNERGRGPRGRDLDNAAYERLIKPYFTSGPRPTTQLDLLAGGYLVASLSLLVGGMFIIAGTTTLAIAGTTTLETGSALITVERTAEAGHWLYQGQNGPIQVVATIAKEGNTLRLMQTHIQGAGRGTSSILEMQRVIQVIGRSEGARKVIVEGARRTSGASPGHIPRPITVIVP